MDLLLYVDLRWDFLAVSDTVYCTGSDSTITAHVSLVELVTIIRGRKLEILSMHAIVCWVILQAVNHAMTLCRLCINDNQSPKIRTLSTTIRKGGMCVQE